MHPPTTQVLGYFSTLTLLSHWRALLQLKALLHRCDPLPPTALYEYGFLVHLFLQAV